MDRKDKYSLLILAGGKSSRMGQNKAELLYEGKTFLDGLISKAKQLGIEKILVSGFECGRDDVTVVWDIYPERGPLGGIHAGMREMKTPFCLVLPVDVPQIPVGVLEEFLMFHVKHTFENKDVQKDLEDGNISENDSIKRDRQKPILLEHGGRRENLIGIYPIEMVEFIGNLIREHAVSVHGMLREWGFLCYEMEIPEWQVENINTQEMYEHLLVECQRKR